MEKIRKRYVSKAILLLIAMAFFFANNAYCMNISEANCLRIPLITGKEDDTQLSLRESFELSKKEANIVRVKFRKAFIEGTIDEQIIAQGINVMDYYQAESMSDQNKRLIARLMIGFIKEEKALLKSIKISAFEDHELLEDLVVLHHILAVNGRLLKDILDYRGAVNVAARLIVEDKEKGGCGFDWSQLKVRPEVDLGIEKGIWTIP